MKAGPGPVKDDAENPVPVSWRPVLQKIVAAFVHHDYRLSEGIESVGKISKETAKQIRDYIEDYGETLVELPEAAWATSIAHWEDDRWLVLVDLWTAEEGRSDLVLHARVREAGSGFRFKVHLVYVP